MSTRTITPEERDRLLDPDVYEEAARLRSMGHEPVDAMYLALDSVPAGGPPATPSSLLHPPGPGRDPSLAQLERQARLGKRLTLLVVVVTLVTLAVTVLHRLEVL